MARLHARTARAARQSIASPELAGRTLFSVRAGRFTFDLRFTADYPWHSRPIALLPKTYHSETNANGALSVVMREISGAPPFFRHLLPAAGHIMTYFSTRSFKFNMYTETPHTRQF